MYFMYSTTAQKMKDFFVNVTKSNILYSSIRTRTFAYKGVRNVISSHLLKKSLMENLIFCAAYAENPFC